MDARVQNVSASTSTSVTLFDTITGKGLHRVYFYNTDDTLPVTLYIRVQEGSTDQQFTLNKMTLDPQTDKKWIGTTGEDDQYILEFVNPWSSTIASDEAENEITTEDGTIIGSTNNLTVNYNWW